MKVFTRDYRITGEWPDVLISYFPGMRPCVLDIETSGLDPSRCRIILIALLVQTQDGLTVTQFLAENQYEEDRVLDAALDFLERESIGYLVTFNGQTFDIPFINSRLSRLYSDRDLNVFNLDVYRLLCSGTDLRKRIGSMSQKSVEDYFGIFDDRRDTITGRESAALFDEYALTGNSTIEKIILTHNREDVLQLSRLMHLIPESFEDFDSAIARHGFPACGGRYSVRPVLKRRERVLRICGKQLASPVSAAFFSDIDSPVTSVFDSLTATYEIDAPLGRLRDNYYIDAIACGIDPDEDPMYVNGYLILDSRTVNLAARLLVEKSSLQLFHAADI